MLKIFFVYSFILVFTINSSFAMEDLIPGTPSASAQEMYVPLPLSEDGEHMGTDILSSPKEPTILAPNTNLNSPKKPSEKNSGRLKRTVSAPSQNVENENGTEQDEKFALWLAQTRSPGKKSLRGGREDDAVRSAIEADRLYAERLARQLEQKSTKRTHVRKRAVENTSVTTSSVTADVEAVAERGQAVTTVVSATATVPPTLVSELLGAAVPDKPADVTGSSLIGINKATAVPCAVSRPQQQRPAVSGSTVQKSRNPKRSRVRFRDPIATIVYIGADSSPTRTAIQQNPSVAEPASPASRRDEIIIPATPPTPESPAILDESTISSDSDDERSSQETESPPSMTVEQVRALGIRPLRLKIIGPRKRLFNSMEVSTASSASSSSNAEIIAEPLLKKQKTIEDLDHEIQEEIARDSRLALAAAEADQRAAAQYLESVAAAEKNIASEDEEMTESQLLRIENEIKEDLQSVINNLEQNIDMFFKGFDWSGSKSTFIELIELLKNNPEKYRDIDISLLYRLSYFYSYITLHSKDLSTELRLSDKEEARLKTARTLARLASEINPDYRVDYLLFQDAETQEALSKEIPHRGEVRGISTQWYQNKLAQKYLSDLREFQEEWGVRPAAAVVQAPSESTSETTSSVTAALSAGTSEPLQTTASTSLAQGTLPSAMVWENAATGSASVGSLGFPMLPGIMNVSQDVQLGQAYEAYIQTPGGKRILVLINPLKEHL